MSRGGRRWVLPIVVMVAAAVVASAAVVLLVGPRDEASASVLLEPVETRGPDPFTDAVGIGEVGAFPTEVRAVVDQTTAALATDPSTGTLAAPGTTPGLYGGTSDNQLCNPDLLVRYLAANPTKAAAWASVAGIEPRGIERFVASLTPVVLTTDTWVTNHGFANGRATPRQAVLQAGTAVMVDARGVPRVRCACGNPLTAPTGTDLGTATVVGTPWTGFAPQSVAVVTPGRRAGELTLVNTETGATFPQQVATPGGPGRWLAVRDNGFDAGTSTIMSSRDGRSWAELGTVDFFVHGLAHGAGRWVAAARTRTDGGVMLTSRDGRSWTTSPTSDRPQYAVGFGDGRFLAGSGSGPDGGPAVVSTSRDGTRWEAAGEIAVPGWWGTAITDLAFADGTWVAVASETWEFDPEDSGDRIPRSRVVTSTDGVAWDVQPDQDLVFPRVAGGASEWMLTGASGYWNDFRLHVRLSPDASQWRVGTAPPGLAEPSGLAFGGGRFLLAAVPGARSSTVGSGTTFVTSTDGRTWSPVGTVAESLSALAFGG